MLKLQLLSIKEVLHLKNKIGLTFIIVMFILSATLLLFSLVGYVPEGTESIFRAISYGAFIASVCFLSEYKKRKKAH